MVGLCNRMRRIYFGALSAGRDFVRARELVNGFTSTRRRLSSPRGIDNAYVGSRGRRRRRPRQSRRCSRSEVTRPQAQQAKPAADSIAAPVITDTGSLEGPRQPIFFRHDIHAGQFKIQCQYCHYSVAVSPEPGIPSMQTCMGCHLVVSGSDSGAQDGDQEGPAGLDRQEAGRVGARPLPRAPRPLPAPAAHQGAGPQRLHHLPRRRRSACRRSSR